MNDQKTLGGENADFSPNRSKPNINDYELIRVIGRGSFGEVWIALDATGSACALKVIYKGESKEGVFWKEFDGVTKYLPVSRSNLGLVTILHVGKDPKKSFYYYTMELADNANKNTGKKWENYRPKTLSSIIESMVDPVSIKRFEEVCLNLSDGLSHLHQEGLVHRDIKPSNVIFVNEQAKLADVGLVSLRADASTFIGTAGYIPPEGPGNPPADIYALGKSLYELLTGKNVGSFPELPTQAFSKHSDSQKFVNYNKLILEATSPDFRDRPRNGRDFKRRFEGISKPAKKKRSTDKITRRPRSYAFGIFALISLMLVGLFFFSPDSKSIPLEDFRVENLMYYNAKGSDLLEGIYSFSEKDELNINCHFKAGILVKTDAFYKNELHTVLFFNSKCPSYLEIDAVDNWKRNLCMKINGNPESNFPHQIVLVRQFGTKGEVLTEASFQNSLINNGKSKRDDNMSLVVSAGEGELIWHSTNHSWLHEYSNGRLFSSINRKENIVYTSKFNGLKSSRTQNFQFKDGDLLTISTKGLLTDGNYSKKTQYELGNEMFFEEFEDYKLHRLIKTEKSLLNEGNLQIRFLSEFINGENQLQPSILNAKGELVVAFSIY